ILEKTVLRHDVLRSHNDERDEMMEYWSDALGLPITPSLHYSSAPLRYPSVMLVRAERRNTHRLKSNAIVTTTASNPRLIHTVQAEITSSH
ncbi:MAG TPA: hypothetical protein VFQ43_16585, partial [Nitrososphaera sp.]|nr:hypothetical protein [Nitrososphaera sp.]